MNKGCIYLFLGVFWCMPSVAQAQITPTEVYVQAQQIKEELQLLMVHFDMQPKSKSTVLMAELKPRHVWQKTYIILTKINIFRRKNALPINTVNSLEPVLNLDPVLVYEQTQRILTELLILKTRLGILTNISPIDERISAKQPIDVFNVLHQISLDLDVLNREEISPAYVFAEVMRIDEDVSVLLQHLGQEDSSFPSQKYERVTPSESLEAAFELLAQVQRLQQQLGISLVDLNVFRKQSVAKPADVFNLVNMILAELQTIKASLNLSYQITPPAQFYENKTPADVHQLLRWITHKLLLIQKPF